MSTDDSADSAGPAPEQSSETPDSPTDTTDTTDRRDSTDSSGGAGSDGPALSEGDLPVGEDGVAPSGDGVLVERSVYEALPDGSHRLTRVIVKAADVRRGAVGEGTVASADPVPAAVDYPGPGASDHPVPVG